MTFAIAFLWLILTVPHIRNPPNGLVADRVQGRNVINLNPDLRQELSKALDKSVNRWVYHHNSCRLQQLLDTCYFLLLLICHMLCTSTGVLCAALYNLALIYFLIWVISLFLQTPTVFIYLCHISVVTVGPAHSSLTCFHGSWQGQPTACPTTTLYWITLVCCTDDCLYWLLLFTLHCPILGPLLYHFHMDLCKVGSTRVNKPGLTQVEHFCFTWQ